MGLEVRHHQKFAVLLFRKGDVAEQITVPELKKLLHVLKHYTSCASVLVAVLNNQIQYIPSGLLLDDFSEMLQQYKNADTILTVSGHTFGERCIAVVRDIEFPRQGKLYSFSEFLANDAGECIDEFHTLCIRPSCKVASMSLKLNTVK